MSGKRLKVVLLVLFTIVPGVIVAGVGGYYSLQDWTKLQETYGHFQQLSGANADFKTLFVAESVQNIHRINLFAEGVWSLLGAVLVGIGLHGICCMPKE